jgi:hypothetical protein
MAIRGEKDYYGDRVVSHLNNMGSVRACRSLEGLRQAGIPQEVRHLFDSEEAYAAFLTTCFRCSRHSI